MTGPPKIMHTPRSVLKFTVRMVSVIALGALLAAGALAGEAKSFTLRKGEAITSLRGPDGLDYPDFRFAGVPGGIPQVPEFVRLADFGAVPDDGLDDSSALARAVAAAGKKGGGAVVIGPGLWHLDHPVDIIHSGIVLRGTGRGVTTLESRFREFSAGSIELTLPAAAEALTRDNYLEVLFDPAGMVKVSISVAGIEVAKRGSDRGRNVEYWLRTSGARIVKTLRDAGMNPAGKHPVRITVERTLDPKSKTSSSGETAASGRWVTNAAGLREWQETNSTTETIAREFVVTIEDRDSDTVRNLVSPPAMISFLGAQTDSTWSLEQDAKRGDLSILLSEAPAELKRGDVLELAMTSSEDYKKSILSYIPKGWSTMRWQAVVQGVEGKRVHLNQPLRVDFPVSERPSIRRTLPIRGAGVESLTFIQSVPRLVNSFAFTQAYGCWLRDVEVIKTGRNPFVFERAKFCEVRDLVATDAWFGAKDNMGGGTAYISFDNNWDSLLDGAVIRGLRHAPNLQGAAQGNVMRRLDTLGTDIQWHAFLTAENLVENSHIRSILSEGGTYGYGAYASGPDSHVHGPNLQGNVVYGNDIESSETSVVHRGGPTAKGWIFAYNRFIVKDQGMALHVQLGLPDLTFIGNVCATPNPAGLYGVASYRAPGSKPRAYNIDEGAAVWVAPGTIDGESFPKQEFARLKVTGLRVLNNRFYGFKHVLGGAVADVQERNNQLLPYAQEEPLPKPDLPAPSLYLWQKQQYPLARSAWPTHPAAHAR
jgi:hypothetical protein